MTIGQILQKGCEQLKGISDSPRLDTEVLLAYTLNVSKEYILSHPNKIFSKNYVFAKLLKQRKRGKPIAYLTGCKEFYGLDFTVTREVLIPRPETEGLVELALRNLRQTTNDKQLTVLDIGTGSGCIAITLAKLLPNIQIIASDISENALLVAQKNAQKHNVQNRIAFRQSNLHPTTAPSTAYVIIANLPYLTPGQIKDNPSLSYEPQIALNGGEDGLQYFRELAAQIKKIPDKPASIFLEINSERTINMLKLFESIGEVTLHNDLSGKQRYAQIYS